MKIAIFLPQENLTKKQQSQLSKLGEVIYADRPLEKSVEEWIALSQGSNVIALDPDNVGGFEKARERVTRIVEALPQLKGVSLDTTSYGWIDLEYCRKRNIVVTNCPHWSRESIAEHTLALLLCLAKQILLTDRRTQKGQYKLEQGFELKGKTLGVIGLGSIGSRTAELGKAIGMNIIIYNHSPRSQKAVEMKSSLTELLKESNAIAIHVTHKDENKYLLSKKELAIIKPGAIIVNAADREIVDEQVMAEALKSNKVKSYAFEGEDLEHGPLANIESAIGIKGFGWNTKEAWDNLMQIWTDNIESIAKGKPRNRIV